MNYRLHSFKKEEHLKLMHRWQEQRDFPIVPEDLLPPIGLVVSHDGVFIAMGFLYRTDGNVAVISHLVSSPVATGEERNEALNIIFANLISVAKEQNFKMVTFQTNLEKLFPRLESFGFVKLDENMSNFGRYSWAGD